MKPEFKERIRKEYRELVEAGIDPHVAKIRILRRKRKLASMLSKRALNRILWRN